MPSDLTIKDPELYFDSPGNKGRDAPEQELYFGDPVVESSVGGLAGSFASGFNRAAYFISGAKGYEEIIKLTQFDEWQKEYGDVGGFLKEFSGLSREPRNSAERAAQRAGEDAVLGAAIAGTSLVMAPVSLALKTAQAVSPKAAPMAERVLSGMVEATKNSPLMASLWETYGWGAFGGAAEYVKEEGGGPVAQMAAGLGAAGGLPLVARGTAEALAPVVKYVSKKVASGIPSIIGARWLWKTFGKPAQEAIAEKQVGRAIESGTAYKEEMDKAYALFDALAVTRPTIAEAGGSPQLLAAQHAIETNASGPTLDFLVGRKTRLAQGVIDAIGAGGPKSSAPQETIIVSARTELNNARRSLSNRADTAERRIEALGSSLIRTDRQQIGSTLRDRRNVLRGEVKDEFKAMADEIGLNNKDALFDLTPYKQAIKEKFFGPQGQLASKSRPKALKDLNEVKVDPKTKRIFESWDGIQSYRQRLNDDISAARFAGKMSEYRSLVEAKSMLDDFVARSEPSMVKPEDWRLFRSEYGEGFINRFEKGVAYDVGKTGRRVQYATRDEEVADAFLRSESTVDDFYRLFGDDPEALIAMRSAILDRANAAAVKDGVVNQAKLSNYLNSHKRVLDKFPDIQASLTSTSDSIKALSARTAVLRKRAVDLESSALSQEVSLLGREGFDSMMDAAIKDPSKMRALVRATERMGYGRAPVATVIWERAMSHVPEGQGIPSLETFKTFIGRNRPSLKIALGEQHVKDLESIYYGVGVVGRTPVPSGQPLTTGPLAALEQQTGTGIPQLSSRVFATASGRVGKNYMMIDLGTRLANRWGQKKAQALMYEALFGREIASDLALFGRSGSPKPVVTRRIRGYLFDMGLGEDEGEMPSMFFNGVEE